MGYFVMYFLLGEFGSLCPLKFVSILSYLVYQHEIIYNIVWLQISYLGALVVMWPLFFLLLGLFSFLISQPNISFIDFYKGHVKDCRLSYSSLFCFWFLFIDFHPNLCNLFSFSYFVFNLLSFFPRILKLKFWSFVVIDLRPFSCCFFSNMYRILVLWISLLLQVKGHPTNFKTLSFGFYPMKNVL